jgi:hypothetical protein
VCARGFATVGVICRVNLLWEQTQEVGTFSGRGRVNLHDTTVPLYYDDDDDFPRSKCIYIERNQRKSMYNRDFDDNPSRAMSLVFKSKIVILFLTGSKRVNMRQFSTRFDLYAGFLAGPQASRRSPRLVMTSHQIW